MPHNKIITLSNQTKLNDIIQNINCDTKLRRLHGDLVYLKVHFKKWIILRKGDELIMDNDYNVISYTINN